MNQIQIVTKTMEGLESFAADLGLAPTVASRGAEGASRDASGVSEKDRPAVRQGSDPGHSEGGEQGAHKDGEVLSEKDDSVQKVRSVKSKSIGLSGANTHATKSGIDQGNIRDHDGTKGHGLVESDLSDDEEPLDPRIEAAELRAQLKALQDEIGAAQGELFRKNDTLLRLRQQQARRFSSARNAAPKEEEKSETPYIAYPPSVSRHPHAEDQVDPTETLLKEEASSRLKGFLQKQVLPVIAKAFIVNHPNPTVGGGGTIIDGSSVLDGGLGEEDSFQAEVHANKQVCSIKVRADCTFRELFENVVSHWAITPNASRQLALGDADGAFFLDHMIVRSTMQRYNGTKARILLLPRHLRGAGDVRVESLESFDPHAVAAEVRRTEALRALLRKHLLAQRAQHTNSNQYESSSSGSDAMVSRDVEQGEIELRDLGSQGHSVPFPATQEVPLSPNSETEHENRRVFNDDDEHDYSSADNDELDLMKSELHGDSDSGEEDAPLNAPILDPVDEAYVDQQIQHIFRLEATNRRLADAGDAHIPNASFAESLGLPQKLRRQTFFKIVDCLVFVPVVIMLLIVVLVGCQRYVFLAQFQHITNQFRKYFELYEPPSSNISLDINSEQLVAWSDVSDRERLYNWLNYTLPSQVFNDINCDQDVCFLNQYHRIVSQLRVRQMQVEGHLCDYVYTTNCYLSYSTSRRSEAALDSSGYTLNGNLTLGNPFKFQDASSDLNFYTSTRRYGPKDDLDLLTRYDASGYFVVPLNSSASWHTVISNLKAADWFNEGSRLLEVSFNTININTGAAITHSFLFQQTETGAVEPVYVPSVSSLRLFLTSYTSKAISWIIPLAIGGAYLCLAYVVLGYCFRMGPDDSMHHQSMLHLPAKRGNRCAHCCTACLRLFCCTKSSLRVFHPFYSTLDFLVVISIVIVFVADLMLIFGEESETIIDGFFDGKPFQNYGPFISVHRVQADFLALVVLCLVFRLVRIVAIFQPGDLIFRAWTSAFATLAWNFLLLYLPLLIAFSTAFMVIFAPLNASLDSYAEVLHASVRLLVGFRLPVDEDSQEPWVILLTMTFSLVIAYFANIVLTLSHIQGFAKAVMQPPSTSLRSIYEWGSAVRSIVHDSSSHSSSSL